MAYITPHTWTSEQATVALMNEINNNLRALFPVGIGAYLLRAATTVETLIDNCWLEWNGVSVLRATYPDLNTLLAGLGYPFGTVDGTHMTLGDAQGRSLVSMASGGHADVNALGDSDGLAKASRTPSHTHVAPGHTHTFSDTSSTPSSTAAVESTAPTINVASLSHTHDVSGTTGSGGGTATSAAATPYLVGGVWFIKAIA